MTIVYFFPFKIPSRFLFEAQYYRSQFSTLSKNEPENKARYKKD